MSVIWLVVSYILVTLGTLWTGSYVLGVVDGVPLIIASTALAITAGGVLVGLLRLFLR